MAYKTTSKQVVINGMQVEVPLEATLQMDLLMADKVEVVLDKERLRLVVME